MGKYPHYVLSYGGGVNSTALLFWLVENKKPLDEVIGQAISTIALVMALVFAVVGLSQFALRDR